MHVVRGMFAVLFALLAVALVMGEIFLIRDHAPIHVLDHAISFALALCLLSTAVYFIHSKVSWNGRLRCPACQQGGTLRLANFGQPRLSAFGWIAGGFIGSLIFTQARKRRFRCDACGESSKVRTPGGWLACAWLFCLVVALGVAIYVHGSA